MPARCCPRSPTPPAARAVAPRRRLRDDTSVDAGSGDAGVAAEQREVATVLVRDHGPPASRANLFLRGSAGARAGRIGEGEARGAERRRRGRETDGAPRVRGGGAPAPGGLLSGVCRTGRVGPGRL